VLGYIEFKTPGFGIFGILAGICFVVFFFGHYVAGLSGYEPIIIFILGVGLIALEAFFFPGLLLPTLVGLCLVVGALIFSMVDRYPTDSIWPSMQQLNQPLTNLAASVAMAVVGAFLVARFFPQRWMSAGLESATISGAAFLPSHSPALGAQGVVLSPLHPAGSVEINGVTYDVVSDGRLVLKGAQVKVVACEGYRIVVSPI
jgi:membrane-bound serine protease (ClpP class)